MMLVDTREQKPMWDPVNYDVKRIKLNEGDYTTDELLNIAHIERKSPIDLYGSIIQGHDRFRREIIRSIDKDIEMAVFVECTEEVFFRKKFPGAYRLKTTGPVLKKIVNTIKIKYNIEFVWCIDRDDMMDKMCYWFADKKIKYDKEIKENGKITENNKK